MLASYGLELLLPLCAPNSCTYYHTGGGVGWGKDWVAGGGGGLGRRQAGTWLGLGHLSFLGCLSTVPKEFGNIIMVSSGLAMLMEIAP